MEATMAKQWSRRPAMTIDPNKRYTATLTTENGDIKLELFPKEAPETVNSFVFLAREGYYENVTFHRVIPGFVAQGGDPTGTGSGGPGYTIPDEVNSHKHGDGALAMAKTAAPNSAGSQFYITLGPQAFLDRDYTVFGQVIDGMDVVKKIRERDPARDRKPGDRIVKITIDES
jgi:cyclophilin family peptidyl-prolyl cis-trans isomerase